MYPTGNTLSSNILLGWVSWIVNEGRFDFICFDDSMTFPAALTNFILSVSSSTVYNLAINLTSAIIINIHALRRLLVATVALLAAAYVLLIATTAITMLDV